MNKSSPQDCVKLDCDRKPAYSVEGSMSVGGSDHGWVCRGHLEDLLFGSDDRTYRVHRLT